jgi:hypothetical protein
MRSSSRGALFCFSSRGGRRAPRISVAGKAAGRGVIAGLGSPRESAEGGAE